MTRFQQLKRFAATCGATLPPWLSDRFSGLDEDRPTQQMIAASVAIEQVRQLRAEGVTAFHFYTLNRSELSYAVCHALGVRPGRAAA